MSTRLFHYSDINSIERFVPRPVKVPSKRAAGFEWLNGPLVWAIDEWHQPMYLFPRDCPRILLWVTEKTNSQDVRSYLGDTKARMVAYIEERWMSQVSSEILYRYELPASSFKSLDDAGMWISDTTVTPISKAGVTCLPNKLEEENVELRVLDSLTPLRKAWNSSLHVSGIRLRNATGWES